MRACAGSTAPQSVRRKREQLNGWSEQFTRHEAIFRAIDSFGNHRGGLYRVRRMVQPPSGAFERNVHHSDDNGVLTSSVYKVVTNADDRGRR